MTRSCKIFLVASLLALGCRCDDNPIKPKVTGPVLSDLVAPEMVAPSESYLIRVRASHSQGLSHVAAVTVSVRKADQTVALAVDTLRDDGAYYFPNDGDVVAKDGIYSQRILWRYSQAVQENFTLRFLAEDTESRESEPLEKNVLSLRNDPPVILAVAIPDTLESGFYGEQLFQVTVSDSQGVENIRQVTFTAWQNGVRRLDGTLFDDGSHGDPIVADGIYTLGVDASFAAGRKGEFQFIFQAEDKLGKKSNEVQRLVVIENEPPFISNLSTPDSVQKPQTGSVLVPITIQVQDPQTLMDIGTVGFLSLKPDSTYANGSKPIPLVDNGLPFDPDNHSDQFYGDAVAGDGMYTFTLELYSDEEADRHPEWTRVLTGNYTFTFKAEDQVGQESNRIEHVLRVY